MNSEETTTIPVWVQPNARRNSVTGLVEGAVQVKVAAPPVEGKANEELVRFLAQLLGVKKGNISIIRGQTARRKVVAVRGLTRDQVLGRLHIPATEMDSPPPPPALATPLAPVSRPLALSGQLEIDLHRLTVDEAIPVLEQRLYRAYMEGRSHLRVVHGKGAGALRAAITRHLKSHPLVQSFRAGEVGEGNWGVTVVELSEK